MTPGAAKNLRPAFSVGRVTGLHRRLPVQIHTGFGDRDLALRDADPALLQPFLAAVEPARVPVVLLHCYPYQRQAGWLALVYPHVYVDGIGASTVDTPGEAPGYRLQMSARLR